jgi:hypothetical protein
MWSKVKGELAAAVAISGGLILAAGYLFVMAQVAASGLPRQPILSALPTTVFVSAALESLVVPFLVFLTLVVSILAFGRRGDAFPGVGWWMVFGAALAIFVRGAALLGVRPPDSWTETVFVSAGVALAVIFLSAAGGAAAGRLLPRDADDGRKLQVLVAIMLVLTVVAASAFRVADASIGNLPLTYVGVFVDTEDCPPVFDVVRQPYVSRVTPDGDVTPTPTPTNVEEKRCYVSGFYLGESDTWMFLAKDKEASIPGRLLLVPRDSAQLTATAKESLSPPRPDVP